MNPPESETKKFYRNQLPLFQGDKIFRNVDHMLLTSLCLLLNSGISINLNKIDSKKPQNHHFVFAVSQVNLKPLVFPSLCQSHRRITNLPRTGTMAAFIFRIFWYHFHLRGSYWGIQFFRDSSIAGLVGGAGTMI